MTGFYRYNSECLDLGSLVAGSVVSYRERHLNLQAGGLARPRDFHYLVARPIR